MSGRVRIAAWQLGIAALLAALTIAVVFRLASEAEPSATLFAAALTGLGIASVCLSLVRRLTAGLLGARLFCASFVLQFVWLTILGYFRLPTIVATSSLMPDVADEPWRVTSAIAGAAVGVVIGATIAAFFRPARQVGNARVDGGEPPPELSAYLNVAVALILVYWISTGTSLGPVGYIIRITRMATLMVPFIAGRYQRAIPSIRVAWFPVLAMNCAIGLLVGGRYVAFAPIAFYMLGYVSSLTGARRRRAIVLVALSAGPALVISGIIGFVRTQVGRGGAELLDAGRITQVFSVGRTVVDNGQLADAVVSNGLMRLIAAPNLAVPILAPDAVPFIGVRGLSQEIAAEARLQAFSNVPLEEFRRAFLDAGLGTARATRFGFLVNEFTSVEFGVIPDGWSRNGLWTVVGFSMMLTLLLITAERIARRVLRNDPAAAMIVVAVIGQMALLDSNVLPLVSFFRAFLLNVTYFVALFRGWAFVRERIAAHGSPERPKPTGPLPSS